MLLAKVNYGLAAPFTLASFFSSELDTINAQAASPVIFTDVRVISSNLSIPNIIPIAAGFKSTAFNTIANIIKPTPGTPAVPIDATTATITTVINCPNVKLAPEICAINIVATPYIIAVPSMLIVAPSGCTNQAISGLTPIFFVQFMETGKAAFELEALNPSVIAGIKPLKNLAGLYFPRNFTVAP